MEFATSIRQPTVTVACMVYILWSCNLFVTFRRQPTVAVACMVYILWSCNLFVTLRRQPTVTVACMILETLTTKLSQSGYFQNMDWSFLLSVLTETLKISFQFQFCKIKPKLSKSARNSSYLSLY